MIPKLPFTKLEYKEQKIQSDTIEKAAKLFRSEGYLYLENIFSPDFIESLHKAYIERYQSYFCDKPSNKVYTVAEKRHKISVELSPPIDSSLLYAHPMILPMIKHLLGDNVILASLASVASLPGSPNQRQHRDHPMLFDAAIDVIIPSYAIKLIIPLVQLDEKTGSTRMWPKSHLNLDKEKNPDSVDPRLSIGDCILMDYRLSHHGLANKSKRVRPILYASYTRPWFQDFKNFKNIDKLILNKKTHKNIAKQYLHLFAQWDGS